MIAKKYQLLLNKLTPFIFTYKDNLKYFNLKALDKDIESKNCFDPTFVSSGTFYSHLRKMDALSFGEQGMSMDGWVYFDCATMPGAIVGFGIPAGELPNKLKQEFFKARNLDPTELVPISMFIAIPMVGGKWFGHNLSSLKSQLGNEYSGLGLLTKAYAVEVLKITEMYGATQWGSAAINIHSKLADMELISSHTLVHSHTNTLCYRSFYKLERILKVLSQSHYDEQKENQYDYDFKVESSDLERQKELQSHIEQGQEYTLVGKPIYRDSEVSYRVRRGFTSKAPK